MSVRKRALKSGNGIVVEHERLATSAASGDRSKNATAAMNHGNGNTNTRDENALIGCPPRGVIRMIGSHLERQQANCLEYEFDAALFQETQRILQLRRRRRRRTVTRGRQQRGDDTAPAQARPVTSSSPSSSFFDVVVQRQGHRFVCFLVVMQYDTNALCHSQHSLSIRKLLALDYQGYVTTIVIMVGRRQLQAEEEDRTAQETDTLLQREDGNVDQNTLDVESGAAESTDSRALGDDDNVNTDLFCHGTGFALLAINDTSLLLSMLNVTQVPSVVVVDTVTGRKLGDNALLAMEHHRDDPERALQAWERGHSGLSCCRTAIATATCQTSSSCAIQ